MFKIKKTNLKEPSFFEFSNKLFETLRTYKSFSIYAIITQVIFFVFFIFNLVKLNSEHESFYYFLIKILIISYLQSIIILVAISVYISLLSIISNSNFNFNKNTSLEIIHNLIIFHYVCKRDNWNDANANNKPETNKKYLNIESHFYIESFKDNRYILLLKNPMILYLIVSQLLF